MPFCPSCREEYDDTVAACAECGATLVASLEEGEAGPAEVKILVENRQVGEYLVDRLLADGVDVKLDSETHEVNGRPVAAVVVPAGVYEYVAVFLTRSEKLQVTETDEEGRGVVGFFDPGAHGAVRRHPLLRKRPREIVAQGEAVVPELVALLEGGDPEVRRWASRRLLDLADPGLKGLGAAMFRAVGAGDRDLVFTAIRVFEEAAEWGLAVPSAVPAAVVEALRARDASVRALAALVVGRYGSAEHVPSLIPLLADPEPLVVEEVVEALEGLTGIQVALHAGSTDAEREAAIRTFRAWRG